MIKKDYTRTEIITINLMAWYGILRWILLSMGTASSVDWVKDWQGNTIAFLSLAYLAYFLVSQTPQKSKLFFAATSILLFVNFYFLILMIRLFFKEPTFANYGYVMLDISIVSFYFYIIKLCFFGDDNKIRTFKLNWNCA